MLPSVPLPPPFLMKLSMPLFEEEGSKVIPTFPLLVFFFLPQSQKRLVTRASRRSGELCCKALFKLRGESAVD